MSLPLEKLPHRPVSRLKILLGLAVVLGAAGGVAAWGISARANQAERLQARTQELSVPTVLVVSPNRPAESVMRLELPGRVEPHTRAPIYSRIAGYLKSWKVDIGAAVKSGQLLAEIETPELDQQIAQAQAELASATANAALSRTTHERWQSLRDQGFVSSQAVEEKRGDLQVKESVMRASQANLDRLVAQKKFSQIVAPFDGVISSRSTDVGALVVAGGAVHTELFTLADIRRERLHVNGPQRRALAIRQGDRATLTVPEHPGKGWPATVQSSAQVIGAGSGSMLVQLAADNTVARLIPGGFAKIIFELPRDSALTVPAGAMIFGSAGPRVAIVDAEDRVRIRRVRVAKDHGNVVELSEGISAEDRVIVSPPDGIIDGDKVKTRTAAAAPAQGGTRRSN
ncbi:MAG: efflux RND transporter periplasmic adaptor subunit [Betaproteobacteria bacterium]